MAGRPAPFDGAARIHHVNAIAGRSHDAEIVADQQHRHVELRAQVFQQC